MARKVSSTLITIGRGISAEGIPSPDTMRRAETTAAYYWTHPREVGRIVCSGAYSKSMPVPPPEGYGEALSIADFLVREAGIPSKKVEVEASSYDTFDNFINIDGQGYLDGQLIDPEHPLGIVAGRAHGIRARMIARQALGVPRNALRVVPSPEGGPLEGAVELGGAIALGIALHGRTPGDLEQTRAAQAQFEAMLGRVRGLPMFSGGAAES